MITHEILVAILKAYISLMQHIGKGVFRRPILRHIYVQQLVASNFAKNRENVKGNEN